MRLVKFIALLLFIGAVTLFSIQNMELVKLSFLNWHLEIPLSFASILLYILGTISGGIVFSMLKKLSVENSNKKNS
jgi:uncharacterized integral membrane protein